MFVSTQGGGGGKLDYPEKTLRVRREPTTNSTPIGNRAGIEPGPHWWDASALTTAHAPHIICYSLSGSLEGVISAMGSYWFCIVTEEEMLGVYETGSPCTLITKENIQISPWQYLQLRLYFSRGKYPLPAALLLQVFFTYCSGPLLLSYL